MAQNDVFEVSVVCSVNGAPTATVMHLEQSTAGDPPLQQAYGIIASKLQADLTSLLLPLLSSDGVIWDCTKIQQLYPTREIAQYFTVNLPGTDANPDPIPPQYTWYERWYSDSGTARGRGRHFWSGASNNHINNGRWTTQYITGLGELAGYWPDIFSTIQEDYQWGIWSSTYNEFNVVQKVYPGARVRALVSRKPSICV